MLDSYQKQEMAKAYTKLGMDNQMTEAERNEWVKIKNAKNINTIKNCVVFFTALTAVSLVLSIILAFVV